MVYVTETIQQILTVGKHMQWYTDVHISRQNDISYDLRGLCLKKFENDLKRMKYTELHRPQWPTSI